MLPCEPRHAPVGASCATTDWASCRRHRQRLHGMRGIDGLVMASKHSTSHTIIVGQKHTITMPCELRCAPVGAVMRDHSLGFCPPVAAIACRAFTA